MFPIRFQRVFLANRFPLVKYWGPHLLASSCPTVAVKLVPSRMNRLDWNLYATVAGKDEPAGGLRDVIAA